MLVDQGYNYPYIWYGHPYKFKFNPDEIIPTSKCLNSYFNINININMQDMLSYNLQIFQEYLV